MIAAGVIGGVFLVCTVVMFLGVKERDGEGRKQTAKALMITKSGNILEDTWKDPLASA